MKCCVRWLVLALCATALIAPAVIALQDAATSIPANQDWPLTGGDAGSSRYSPLSQINPRTLSQLGGAWISPKFDDGATSRSMPVIKDGLMFVVAGSRVYALNAKTGSFVWNFNADTKLTSAELASGREGALAQLETLSNSGHTLPNAQGVAVAEGKVFFGIANGYVIALDEKTGDMQWSKRPGGEKIKNNQGLVVPTAPTYADGMVFVGTNGDFGLDAKIVALDAKTGNELWRFFVVPRPGVEGHQTWPKDNDAWKHGGGGVWQTGAVDPDLGLVYFGTGNAVPQYGGEVRKGDNLYTDCVVALDMKTGKPRWHYQLVHHDIWEEDIALPVVLYDTQINGRPVKGIAAMRPDGYLFLFDRATGKPLVPIEERPVPQSAFQNTAPTQPFPVVSEGLLPKCSSWQASVPKGWTLACEFQPWDFGSTILAPGVNVRVTPMSYSPATGYLYAQGSGSVRPHRRISDDPWFFSLGGGEPDLLGLPPARNFLAAIDGRTDQVVWKKEIPARELGRGFSGTMDTAGGLLFHPTSQGSLEAYDAKDGSLLWQFQTAGQGGPIATYEIDGTQYVAMVTGPSVEAFTLGGTVQPVQLARSPNGAAGQANEANAGEETDQIEVATLVRDHDNSGQRYATDEHTFNPTRARVKVGTRVIFLNNGRLTHTIVARDGSWTTGALQPADSGSVVFDKPGTYIYICKDHPWAAGEIIVVGDTAQESAEGIFTREQAERGKAAYTQSCSTCHQADLSGLEQVPALKGDSFLAQWQGHPLSELVDRTRTTMPQANPGSLSRETYLDIVAYILQMNNLPAGKAELKTGSATLKDPIR